MEISFSDIMAVDEVMHKISQMTPKEAFKFGYKYAQREIDKWLIPSVQPEQKGEWIVLDECSNEGIYCSKCRKKVFKIDYSNTMKWKNFNFCPYCGQPKRGKQKPEHTMGEFMYGQDMGNPEDGSL